MAADLVRLECSDGIATLHLDRPPVNAIDLALILQAEAALAEVATMDIRALVLTGAGACFSAGLDLKQVPLYSIDDQRRTIEAINRACARLYALPVPVVGAINGHAIAGGLVLALACDHRVGARGNSKLGLTETRAGIPFPAVAMSIVQAELSGAVARRLTLMARNYGPEEALRDGILDELCDAGAVLERARAVAADLGSTPRDGYARIKRQLRAAAIARHDEVIAGGDALVEAWFSAETGAASASLLRSNE